MTRHQINITPMLLDGQPVLRIEEATGANWMYVHQKDVFDLCVEMLKAAGLESEIRQ